MKMTPTTQKVVKYATVGGASILIINSAIQLANVKSVREAVMPIINILVGVSAFACATMPTGEVKVEEPKLAPKV
jgi:sulfite exporter TauE/SafE